MKGSNGVFSGFDWLAACVGEIGSPPRHLSLASVPPEVILYVTVPVKTDVCPFGAFRDDASYVTMMVGFMLSVLGTLFLTISSGSIQGMKQEYSEPMLNVFRFGGSFLLAPPALLYK